MKNRGDSALVVNRTFPRLLGGDVVHNFATAEATSEEKNVLVSQLHSGKKRPRTSTALIRTVRQDGKGTGTER